MPEQLLVEHCAPTFAGIKVGNLFSMSIDEETDVREELREINKLLRKKGLRAIPVRITENKAFIFLYRPNDLSRALRDPEAQEILREQGYHDGDTSALLAQLVYKIRKNANFPHEIGLFLGYPPVDVRGFMNSPTNGVKCAGYWKVYGDEEKALKTFNKYKKCTEVYCRLLACGRPLSKMIVKSH